jgi:hypothetical protein
MTSIAIVLAVATTSRPLPALASHLHDFGRLALVLGRAHFLIASSAKKDFANLSCLAVLFALGGRFA